MVDGLVVSEWLELGFVSGRGKGNGSLRFVVPTLDAKDASRVGHPLLWLGEEGSSRFPEQMTDRKASARATATAGPSAS